MDKRKFGKGLLVFAGILLLLAALVGQKLFMIPIGLLFVVLGFTVK